MPEQRGISQADTDPRRLFSTRKSLARVKSDAGPVARLQGQHALTAGTKREGTGGGGNGKLTLLSSWTYMQVLGSRGRHIVTW